MACARRCSTYHCPVCAAPRNAARWWRAADDDEEDDDDDDDMEAHAPTSASDVDGCGLVERRGTEGIRDVTRVSCIDHFHTSVRQCQFIHLRVSIDAGRALPLSRYVFDGELEIKL